MAINVSLNGETRQVSAEMSLDQLLELFSLPSQRIAVELNRSVIRRADWRQTVINEGDKIEVVYFVGGG